MASGPTQNTSPAMCPRPSVLLGTAQSAVAKTKESELDRQHLSTLCSPPGLIVLGRCPPPMICQFVDVVIGIVLMQNADENTACRTCLPTVILSILACDHSIGQQVFPPHVSCLGTLSSGTCASSSKHAALILSEPNLQTFCANKNSHISLTPCSK